GRTPTVSRHRGIAGVLVTERTTDRPQAQPFDPLHNCQDIGFHSDPFFAPSLFFWHHQNVSQPFFNFSEKRHSLTALFTETPSPQSPQMYASMLVNPERIQRLAMRTDGTTHPLIHRHSQQDLR